MAATDSSTDDLTAPIFSEDPEEVKRRAVLAMAGPTLLMKGKSHMMNAFGPLMRN